MLKKDRKCGLCQKIEFPMYAKELKEEKIRDFQSIKVACRYKNEGCNQELSLIGNEIAEHEVNCLKQCQLCLKYVPESYMLEHKQNSCSLQDYSKEEQKDEQLNGSQVSQEPRIIESQLPKAGLMNELQRDKYSEQIDFQKTLAQFNQLEKEKISRLQKQIREFEVNISSYDKSVSFFKLIAFFLLLALIAFSVMNFLGGYEESKLVFKSLLAKYDML